MRFGSKIFILGSSGFAREIKSYLLEYYRYKSPNGQLADMMINSTGIIEPEFYFVGPEGMSVKQYHELLNSNPLGNYSIMGSGQCDIKTRMLTEIRAPFISVVHPSSHVIEATIGIGSVIAPGSVVAPHVTIGKHVLVNYNASIGHDTYVGDLSVVSPQASIGGNCKLETAVYVGSSATIKEGLTIGANSIIGMGAVITKDVPPNSVVVGNPGKIRTKDEWQALKKN